MTQVLFTVDTELPWRHFRRGRDWRELFERGFDPAGVGVPYQLEQLRRHDLKACFFVDPMPAIVYGFEPIRRMVEPILEAGQEVQLHLHSFWFDLAAGRDDALRFDLTDFDARSQQELVVTARDLLIAAGAPPPTAFRSGSYAADRSTLAALKALGIAFDSSHNGCDHPSPSALPLRAAQIDPLLCDGVVELPISLIHGRGGRLRPLQLCAVSAREMEMALLHALEQDHPLVTLVSHSFELASRDGRRRNRTVRNRFDRLCRFLDRHRESLPTARVSDIAVRPGRPSVPMAFQPTLSGRRLVEQLWADACYERPATAATALGGPLIAFGDWTFLAGF